MKSERRFFVFFVSAALLFWAQTAFAASIPAFPGAEGYGAATPGGRGGKVYVVTTLADAVPAPAGSLRECIRASGPRTCVFAVGGLITLADRLQVEEPFLTIAGQTAPGGGITITGRAGITIETNDVIVRYIRIRLDGMGESQTGQVPYGIRWGGRNVVLDHCSGSWTKDKNLIATNIPSEIRNVTMQRCLHAEALSEHPTALLINGPMDYSVFPPIEDYLNVHDISVHHNLFAHNTHRNPRIVAGPTQVINNVVYNWRQRAGSSAAASVIDYIGNYWKPGPMTNDKNVLWHESKVPNGEEIIYPLPSIYIQSNIAEGIMNNPSANNWVLLKESQATGGGGVLPENGYRRYNPLPRAQFAITKQSASGAYAGVLADVGANARLDCKGNWVSNSDAVDIRIINDVRAGTGWTSPPLTPEEAGGIPSIIPGTPCADADKDGMPDEWEFMYKFDISNPQDNNEDADGDGYTNIEEYLNGTVASNAVAPAPPITIPPITINNDAPATPSDIASPELDPTPKDPSETPPEDPFVPQTNMQRDSERTVQEELDEVEEPSCSSFVSLKSGVDEFVYPFVPIMASVFLFIGGIGALFGLGFAVIHYTIISAFLIYAFWVAGNLVLMAFHVTAWEGFGNGWWHVVC